PCTGGTVEQLAKCLVIGHSADQLVSILTNSGFRFCQSSFAASLKKKAATGQCQDSILYVRCLARAARLLCFIRQLSLPPQEERRVKTKSQTRLDRVDEVNILFPVEPSRLISL